MENSTPFLVVGIIVALIALGVIWYIITRFLVNVGAHEVAIKERRYFGRRMPQGRVVATEGEVGMQADVLKPGLHFVMYPIERVVRKVPLVEIGADELGIIEAIDGEPMPTGQHLCAGSCAERAQQFSGPDRLYQAGRRQGHSTADAAARKMGDPSVPLSRFGRQDDGHSAGQGRHRHRGRRRAA